MMHFSTEKATATNKNRLWSRTVSETYFPLSVECRDPDRFEGSLKSWSLGAIGLSEMECGGVMYARGEAHFRNENENSFLITIPHLSDVHFEQASRHASCKPGAFLMERGDIPYEFSHAEHNRLWVLKVPTTSLKARLESADRLSALTFDAGSGVSSLFVGAVRNAIENVESINDTARELTGQHLLDLLCLSLRNDERILDSSVSTIRAAHLQRAEQFIRDNLSNPKLNSRLVAESCGISLRYLQQLFSESNHSVVGYIRDKRLTRCHEILTLANNASTIGEIALDWGFYDQAQFCNHYRNRFGCTPGDTRKQSRLKALEESR
jgi:AraC-like DNA-binding protein